MDKWSAYKKKKYNITVSTQIFSQHKLMVENNRKYVTTLVYIIIFISCRGFGFRGHDETKYS